MRFRVNMTLLRTKLQPGFPDRLDWGQKGANGWHAVADHPLVPTELDSNQHGISWIPSRFAIFGSVREVLWSEQAASMFELRTCSHLVSDSTKKGLGFS